MNLLKTSKLLIVLAIIFTSCKPDDDNIFIPRGNYENGIIITNEGIFGQGNASVSFATHNFDYIENNVFSNMNNNALLGDTAQSIGFYEDLAYIVLNGSNKIEIVDRQTFKKVSTINTGLSNPRYIAFSNGKGYVTNWGDATSSSDDYLAIIDLSTNILKDTTIPVAEGPEKIIANGNTLYVALEGGYNHNDKVLVVDAITDAITQTITVGDVPNSLQLDASGNLWVLCGGIPAWTGTETGGKLFKINTTDYSTTSIDFSNTQHPDLLSLANDKLYYYLTDSVFTMPISSTTLPTSSILTGLNFYNMTIKNDVLYGVDAKDYASAGSLLAYSLTSNTLIHTATLGIIPNGIYFN